MASKGITLIPIFIVMHTIFTDNSFSECQDTDRALTGHRPGIDKTQPGHRPGIDRTRPGHRPGINRTRTLSGQ